MRRILLVGTLCASISGGLAAWADGLTVPFSFPVTACTNQFIRSLAVATGAGTCSTIVSADISGSFTGITGVGTLTAGSTGSGFTVAVGTSTITGILPAANGGAGTINGALKSNGSGTVSQAACADLSNATGACSATYVSAGSWTPADGSGASLTFTSVSASYNRIGNMVWIGTQFAYPVTATGNNAVISGLPVTAGNANYAKGACSITSTAAGIAIAVLPNPNTTTATLVNAVGAAAVTNAQLSASVLVIGCWYPAT